jgi:hypothetical protein
MMMTLEWHPDSTGHQMVPSVGIEMKMMLIEIVVVLDAESYWVLSLGVWIREEAEHPQLIGIAMVVGSEASLLVDAECRLEMLLPLLAGGGGLQL